MSLVAGIKFTIRTWSSSKSVRETRWRDDMRFLLIGLVLAPLLSGCIAKTAINVATAPVRVASGAVDMATTSQSEADEKRGREMRKREERLGRLERRYYEQQQSCDAGKEAACEAASGTYAEIDALKAVGPDIP